MADRVKYAISVTPVEMLSDDNSGTHDVIAGEIGKSLGGSGEAELWKFNQAANIQGYLNTEVNYREATNDGSAATLSSEADASFVFIKNTGHEYDNATTLGDSFDYAIEVTVNSGSTLISVLDSGEALVLKDDNNGIDPSDIAVETVTTGGSSTTDGTLAVEFLVTTTTMPA